MSEEWIPPSLRCSICGARMERRCKRTMRRCRACNTEYYRVYREANRERVRAIGARSRGRRKEMQHVYNTLHLWRKLDIVEVWV